MLMPIVHKNHHARDMRPPAAHTDNSDTYPYPDDTYPDDAHLMTTSRHAEARESLVEMREFDVPYLMRVAIDSGIRVGVW